MHELKFHDDAEDEFIESLRHYSKIDPNLAKRLYTEAKRCLR